MPNLLAPDEIDALVAELRPAAKAAGAGETRDAVRSYFIAGVRDRLHLAFCVSPVDGGHFHLGRRALLHMA